MIWELLVTSTCSKGVRAVAVSMAVAIAGEVGAKKVVRTKDRGTSRRSWFGAGGLAARVLMAGVWTR
jgi:hypothetical protein